MTSLPRTCQFLLLTSALLCGTVIRSEAKTLFLQSGEAIGYREITPDQELSYDTWVQQGSPGIYATPFRIQEKSVLRTITLEMATSPGATGGFSLSLHAYIRTRTGSYLKTVAELSGTDNPATAGKHLYQFPEGFSPEPGVYFLVARVAPGGGTYRWTTTGGKKPQIGSGGQIYAVTSEAPSSLSSGGSSGSSGSSIQLGGSLTINSSQTNWNASLSAASVTTGATLNVATLPVSNHNLTGSLIFTPNQVVPNPTLIPPGATINSNTFQFTNGIVTNLDPITYVLPRSTTGKTGADLSDIFLVGQGESGPQFRFTLTGEPVAFARLAVDRPAPFKPVRVGKKGRSQQILIRNTGTTPLTRLSIHADPETRQHFEISFLLVRTLEPQATAKFLITAKPRKPGPLRGRVEIISAEASRSIPLIGRGTGSSSLRGTE